MKTTLGSCRDQQGRASALARRLDMRSSTAFTLVEMLVVVAIIAMLSALTLPALQGLLGTSGLKAGVNSVLSTLDNARSAAIVNGTDVYVGFPPPNFNDPADPNTPFTSMIVFRGPKPDEPATTFKPLSRWVRLPAGVVMQTTNISMTKLDSSPAALLPKLASQEVDPVVIRYDRFGRIRTPVTDKTNIVIGEAIVAGGNVQWKGDNRQFLTAQPLTGRWISAGNE
jgi:prepilin-type N-terminal cleavage/methylation domain-containing protein